jgi:hypothetical protein
MPVLRNNALQENKIKLFFIALRFNFGKMLNKFITLKSIRAINKIGLRIYM